MTTDPMLPRPFLIKAARRELSDTFSIDLEPRDGERQIAFDPGQFNMLYVFGIGEVPISISGDPADANGLVHTVRKVGPATMAMATLKRGATLGVRGPFGAGWPLAAAAAAGRDLVFVAGGLGLAPLRPAIYHALNNRAVYGSVGIFYGARTPKDILFERELHRWRGRFDLTVEVTVDRAATDWTGRVGVVTGLLERGVFDPAETVAMICGPEVMMRHTMAALNRRGVDDQRIYLSMERNMQCAVGFCGHCQFGGEFVCKDGPVFRYADVRHLFAVREI